MNAIYRIGNALVGTIFAAIMGYAIYLQAPSLWHGLDSACFSAVLVVTLVGILAVGFATLESRKV